MGLDVYLYRYEDHEKSTLLEAKYEKETEEIWAKSEEYDKLTDEEKEKNNQECKAVAERLGLGEYGEDSAGREEIERNSEKYPDHLFKVGYFRSSYNSGGINHILRNINGDRDLYWVFDHDSAEYSFCPDWEQAKQRAQELIELLSKNDPYYVSKVAWNMFSEPPDVNSEKEALDIFKKELAKQGGSRAYSNKNGLFYLDEPLPVCGIISGQEHILSNIVPCVYVIHKSGADDGYDFYIQALEIVVETCEYVLSFPDPKKYWLHWSS